MNDFFTLRAPYSGYVNKRPKDGWWGWLSIYPQAYYYADLDAWAEGRVEQITVGTAMNHNYKLGLLAPMNGEYIMGRSYTSDYPNRYEVEGKEASKWGYNLAEQFRYALEVDPQVIFITGWNEWVAGRAESWQGVTNAFPDQFNDYFSRDIEPSNGQLKDHYYYQMVSYIRQFKGTRALPEASDAVTIDVSGSASQWDNVSPNYYTYQNNTGHRDSDGYLGTHYTNETGRNDLSLAKVARDAENVYFYIECENEITDPTDERWMRLLLNIDDSSANWEGYEFILNREKAGVLERSLGGWKWETVGEVQWSVSGKVLQISIPRSMLGLPDGAFTLRFKWADNNLTENEAGEADILDFYQYGDAAPGGRFQYRYEAGN